MNHSNYGTNDYIKELIDQARKRKVNFPFSVIFDLGISQLMICRPLPLSFAPIFMKDAHSTESNEKYIF